MVRDQVEVEVPIVGPYNLETMHSMVVDPVINNLERKNADNGNIEQDKYNGIHKHSIMVKLLNKYLYK